MPRAPIVNLVLRAVALIIAAAGIYLAATGDFLDGLFLKPVYMYGGEHKGRDVATEVEDAVNRVKGGPQQNIHLVVQFKRILTPSEKATLEDVYEIDIQEHIPENAYVVALPVNRAEQILESLKHTNPPRRGVVAINAADKLSPQLNQAPVNRQPPDDIEIVLPDHARFFVMPGGARVVVSPPPTDSVAMAMVIVHFFADISRYEQKSILLADDKVDGEILALNGQGKDNQWQITISVDSLKELLQNDSVRWVEAVRRPPVDDLNEARAVAGYSVFSFGGLPITHRDFSVGGAGAGVTIAQWESCPPRTNHPGLMSSVAAGTLAGSVERVTKANIAPTWCGFPVTRTQIGYCDGPCDAHATMVAGIYMGNGNGSPCQNNPQAGNVLIGTNVCSPDDFQGMAAKAEARAYALVTRPHTVGNRPYDIVDLPELKLNYMDAIREGAVISQNSWGDECDIYSNPGGPHTPTNSLFSFYSGGSEFYDTVVSGRDSKGRPSGYPGRILVVTSAGNYGDEMNIPSLWGSARVINSAKNVVSVGNVNTHPLDQRSLWAHLSSGRGPTADGRITPILSAPGIRFYSDPDEPYEDHPRGTHLHGIHGIRTTYPEVNSVVLGGNAGLTQTNAVAHTYKASWGTSFSAPIVSGAAALLTEAYRNTCLAEPSPRELRALLIHTAHDLKEAYSSLGNARASLQLANDGGCNLNLSYSSSYSGWDVQKDPVYEGPDYIYGFGMVQADKAKAFAAQSHFTTGEIPHSGNIEYKIRVGSDTKLEDGKLRFTLVWDDPPWPVNAPESPSHGLLQNDLDLEVIDPSGRIHLPWVLNPEDPAAPAKPYVHRFGPLRDKNRDRRNTIEQIEIEINDEERQFGVWTIRVWASQMVLSPQAFTLVSSAIVPAETCGEIPSQSNENPIRLPNTWLTWWLFWLALLILILLIIELLRLIWKTCPSPLRGRHAVAALLLLAVVGVLIFYEQLIALGVLLLLLVILTFCLGY